jgi:hypothetical protein
MTAEKIIETFDGWISTNVQPCHLILQKIITTKPFKAFKEYKYVVWNVEGKKKLDIANISTVAKSTNDSEEEQNHKEMDKRLLLTMIELIKSPIIKNILEGNYDIDK